MTNVLQVKNLGKSYHNWGREWRRVASWFIPFFKPYGENWVLKNVNITLQPGEAIGIIGQNGAGKSTLLKIITGTTSPTEGSVEVNGRVSAILELGMGFSPDLTGRQNAYHSAGLMGYSHAEIEKAMPDIEAFAEIGDYFDKPVRTYSSGMQMRVAFSVATAFRPDILIIDEALSVGDVYFQQKCFQRIRAFSSQGTTLLFVTHDIVAVLEICNRAIYIRQGSVVVDGQPQQAVTEYQLDIMQDHPPVRTNIVTENHTQNKTTNQFGNLITPDVTFMSVKIQNDESNEIKAIISGHSATLVIRYKVNRDLDDPHVGFKIHTRIGTVIFETNTFCMGRNIGIVKKDAELETRFQFPIDLAPGEYTITVGFANQGYDRCEFKERLNYLGNIFGFTVLPNSQSIIWSGIININPQTNWTITSCAEQAS